MEQLQLARQVAIGLGGAITSNDVGFITCFSSTDTAQSYTDYVNEDLEELTAEQQERCVVVVTIESLM
ncbi:hypothetical protein [Leptothoe spongobia]|uniref:Uncharacterized protein n=1 Tax=Leptothoe spongobia TAU-MAC 1115 TaxID=1967444 RepID=A0A947GJI7_9CYAN|nr:hypothetical protein [Leptothoe spongobia]MBT9316599.1 hypothetical protein [Leptothoe spongobia TAU-MAC 1115]